MNKSDLFWVTGFWEGEGWAFYHFVNQRDGRDGKVYRFKRLQVGCSQNEKKPLEYLKLSFGGSIHKCTGTGLGKTIVWSWRAGGMAGYKFLRAIYPHLRLWKRIRKVRPILSAFKFNGKPWSNKGPKQS